MRRLLCLALLAALSPALAEEPAIGARVAPFTAVDVRYLPCSLDDLGEPGITALVFATRKCPIALRALPKLRRLAGDYAERGVRFVFVDVTPDPDVNAMAAFALEHELPFPALKDAWGEAARAVGATRSPEVAVLDAERVLRYRGRVDDQLRLGGTRAEPTRRDLVEALDELLAGQPVSVPETPVDGCKLSGPARPSPHDRVPTWNGEVAALVQRHCQDCHREGGSAPFALTRYEDARDTGDMLAEVVEQGRMPPWFAVEGPEQFSNHRGLDAAQRATLVAWVQGGMPRGEGEPPAPRAFPKQEWAIKAPDLVLAQPGETAVVAEGSMPYQYVMLPHRFEHDTWVEAIEIQNAVPEVLHHCNLFFLRPGKAFDSSQVIAGKVPGGPPLQLGFGVATLIPKGSLLGLQIHYQPNGTAVQDSVRVGFRFPRGRVHRRFYSTLIERRDFEVPAGANHHRVDAETTLEHPALLIALFGHMHLRGKAFSFDLQLEGGEPERLLTVPNYSFDWQMAYVLRQPRFVPAGARIRCSTYYDNSPLNGYNPDPSRPVGWGLQSQKEMLYHFVFYLRPDEDLDLAVDPATGAPQAPEDPAKK
ncbi:MAG: redoxin domain-containing protein [Planctomycetota bacterium]